MRGGAWGLTTPGECGGQRMQLVEHAGAREVWVALEVAQAEAVRGVEGQELLRGCQWRGGRRGGADAPRP